MELHRFFPFIHDDISDSLWRVDRTSLGLHASSNKIGINEESDYNSIIYFYENYFQGNPSSCLAIFIPALVVGNFMVLNLFLALLLNNFNSDELKQRKEVRK